MGDGYDMDEPKRLPIYAEYRGPGPLAYNLRTLVGTNDHCLTKKIGPSYSIGLKWKDDPSLVPGPGYSFDSYLTSKGRQMPPSFSLSSRAKPKDLEITPGPGSYNPQAIKQGAFSNEKKVPAISIGQRTRWPFKNEAPPPNSYGKPTTLGPGTVSGRGAPAWSFQARTDFGGSAYDSLRKGNPGPGSYGAIEPNTVKHKSGCFSIQGRTKQKDYNSAKLNPGPGSYEPKKLPAHSGKGFTMGTRHSEYVLPLICDTDIM